MGSKTRNRIIQSPVQNRLFDVTYKIIGNWFNREYDIQSCPAILNVRAIVFVVLLAGIAHIATAQDYVTPPGVSLLTEEQLLTNIIGNTLMGRNNRVGKWAEYYEPSKVGKSYGSIYGKTKRSYSGSWKIDGALMCFYYRGSGPGGCWTLELDGNIVTWYKPNGEKVEQDFPTMLIPDNPNNF